MQKVLFLLPVLFFYAVQNFAQNRIVANVSNLKNNKGMCIVCLFNSSENFKNNTAFRCIQSGISNQTAQVTFSNVPAGSYAVFVFHDANNNKKMDKNFFGIPKEGYGASQNNLPFAGAPKFEDNKFDVGKTSTIILNMKLRNIF